jgi:hypothetical protein
MKGAQKLSTKVLVIVRIDERKFSICQFYSNAVTCVTVTISDGHSGRFWVGSDVGSQLGFEIRTDIKTDQNRP